MAASSRQILLSRDLDPVVWRASLEVAEAVCEGTSPKQTSARLIEILDSTFGFDVAGIHSAAPGEPWTRGPEKGNTSIFLANNWRYVAQIGPEEAQRVSRGFALDTDVFNARRRERLAIYQEFVYPNHIASGVLRFWVMDGRVWIMALCRDRPHSFGRAIARLDLLFPHLRAAIRAAAWWAKDAERGDPPEAWELTPRQERIVSLVTRGLTNQETASLLGLSAHTVRNALVDVFQKLGVSRRSELAFLARSAAFTTDLPIGRHELARQRRSLRTFAARDT